MDQVKICDLGSAMELTEACPAWGLIRGPSVVYVGDITGYTGI